MITRVVKMHFHEKYLEEFCEIFSQSKELIMSFDGCINVELMKDADYSNRIFTISLWQSEEQLNLYRESDLFKTVWAKVKPLFSEKAEAWSLINQSTPPSPSS